MTAQGKGQELLDKVAGSRFAKDVLGPKVIKPASDWYEGSVLNRTEPPELPAVEGSPAEVVIEPRTRTVSKDLHPAAPSGDSANLSQAAAAVDQRTSKAMGDAPDVSTQVATSSAATAATTLTVSETVSTDAKGSLSRVGRIRETLALVAANIKEHNLVVVAAGIAFWGLLAIPAVLAASLSIYGMVADPADVEEQIQDNLSGAPEEVQTIIAEQLEGVASASGGSLLTGAIVGLLLALWTSSGAMAKLMGTFNTIFGVSENRKFPKLRGTALALTFGSIVFIGAAVFLLAALPAVTDAAGMGSAGRSLLNIVRFPALLLVMSVALGIIYWMGPAKSRKYRLLTAGAVIATVLWVLISAAFSFYTASFASYNETYGTLGALVILLLFLFITAFMVLIGAEIDAANEAQAQ